MRLRSRTQRPGRWARAHVGGCLGLLLAVLMMLTLIPPGGTSAEDDNESGVIPLQAIQFLQPIEDSLAGSSWLMSQGLDPRIMARNPERNAITGWDWSSTTAGAGGGGGGGGAFQQVPFRSPAPAFSRNLIVTRQVGLFPIQTEPHIAVDPTDPEHLVLGVIDYNFPSMSSYVSFDGGETWEGPNQVRYFREDFSAAGDPVVAFDQDGNVYITSISLGIEEFRLGSLVSAAQVSSMVVSKSLDGGVTWEEPVSAARSTISAISQLDEEDKERGIVTLSFLDKPWMTVGPNPDDPEIQSIYLSYTNFATSYSLLYADELPFLTSPVTETTIRVVRSDDGGVTWTQPLAVSPAVLQAEGASAPGGGETTAADVIGAGPPTPTPTPGPDDESGTSAQEGGAQTQQQQQQVQTESERTVQGSQPKVMADGTVVIAYLDTTNDGIQKGLATIMVVLSEDGGRTYSEPIQAGVIREPHFRARNSFFRYWGTAFPQLAVGPNGEIYIATTGLPADKPTDDGDIYVFRSLDKGENWEEGVLVNQDPTSRLQFFPSIDVSPDGVLHAMWADMRDDPMEARYHIYYSRSEDQGESWGFTLPDQDFTAPDTRVTDFPSNSLRGFPNGLFIGDYFSLAAAEEDVYMVWADTRLGEFGAANQQIGFARQTAIRSPELFLSPPSGPSGRIIDIQGFDFQPTSDVILLVGGVIVTNERTDGDGQFQTQIFMPVTGEGPTSIQAFDETGNGATASFFTDFGFDTIQRSLEQINDQMGIETPVPGPAPAATPVASPVASPVGTPSGGADATPIASGSPPLAVSSNAGIALTGWGMLALVAGLIASAGALRRRCRRWT